MDPENVSSARTPLLVSGHRSHRFGEAVSSWAAMIFDLADAVEREREAEARAAVETCSTHRHVRRHVGG